MVAWDEPGVGRSSAGPDGFDLAGFADALAAVVTDLGLGPAHLAGLSWGGTVVLECWRRHPDLVATLILMDTYAGWSGSLPADEVARRVEGVRQMVEAGGEDFDPTLPGLFGSDPSDEVVALMEEMAAEVRPETLALGGDHGGDRPRGRAPSGRCADPARVGRARRPLDARGGPPVRGGHRRVRASS